MAREALSVEAEPVALAALNELVEAHLSAIGPKKAGEYLRAVAARVATPEPEGVVAIRDPQAGNNRLAARSWLHGRLAGWFVRYG
jgi:hypothetical protein